jgi:Spy/CpxP family protein refolding chaperone
MAAPLGQHVLRGWRLTGTHGAPTTSTQSANRRTAMTAHTTSFSGIVAFGFALAGSSICFAQTAPHNPSGVTHGQHGALPAQPNASQQARGITSLSADEVQGFLEGRGMGLAKPAELNGFPGPMHVLELDKDLALTDVQRAKMKASMDTVKAKTRILGAHYIAAERALDEAFRANAGPKVIAARVAAANKLLGDIRYAHLTAHLEITPLLTASQRARYAALRGYPDHSQHKP